MNLYLQLLGVMLHQLQVRQHLGLYEVLGLPADEFEWTLTVLRPLEPDGLTMSIIKRQHASEHSSVSQRGLSTLCVRTGAESHTGDCFFCISQALCRLPWFCPTYQLLLGDADFIESKNSAAIVLLFQVVVGNAQGERGPGQLHT